MPLSTFAGWFLAVLFLVGDPFSFEYPGQTDTAGGAFLVVKANDNLKPSELVISGDGQEIRKTLPAMKSGQSFKVKWKQRSSQAKYQLVISGGGVEANFAFEMVKKVKRGKAGKLQVLSSRDDIVKRHTAKYKTSFELTSYEYKVYDDDGDVVASKLVTDNVIPAGGTFDISWNAGVTVFMVWVRGEDKFGRFTEYKLVPWSVKIPHTEVNFDTAKAVIKPGEAPKVDEAMAVAFHELDALDRVNKAVGANIQPQLYIVGYTDTVGRPSSNQKLSNSRAKAIAQYFYDHGFWAEIFYAGMGERGLRVETGDNVDEVRNRRALYLLGVQKPGAGGQIPGRWTRLAGPRAKPPGFELPALPERWAKLMNEDKGGSGDGTNDRSGDLPEGGGGDGDDGGDGGDPQLDGLDYGDDGPPAMDDGGGPGATKKGCSVIGQPQPPPLAMLLLLAGALRRRRRVAR